MTKHKTLSTTTSASAMLTIHLISYSVSVC